MSKGDPFRGKDAFDDALAFKFEDLKNRVAKRYREMT